MSAQEISSKPFVMKTQTQKSLTLTKTNLRAIDRPTVEVYLDSKFSNVTFKHLAPSAVTFFLEVGRLFTKPTILVLSLIPLALFLVSKFSTVKTTYQSVVLKLADVTETEFLDDLSLSTRLDSLEEMLLGNASMAPTILADQKSQIKFISGLIAVHRPNIPDCGSVAREIVEISAAEKVDPFFVAAVISVESRFATEAMSRAGARGLMQLMPATAREIARVKTDAGMSKALTNERLNILVGVAYIKQLNKKYRGNRALVLGAYNWGPAKVDRANRKISAFPKSVRTYIATIEERTKLWARHYQKAKEGALALDTNA